MPATGDVHAQRIRYPNGTVSDPFLVPWSKANMVRLAKHLLDDNWREAECNAGHDPESSRLACAYDGRFWSTVGIWMQHVCDYTGLVPRSPDMLSMAQMLVLFGRDDEYGWHTLMAMGVTDPKRALARTVLAWSSSVEEWS